MGGGGGNEIDNKIEVYKLDDPKSNILKTKVHEVHCDNACPNYFEVPYNVRSMQWSLL